MVGCRHLDLGLISGCGNRPSGPQSTNDANNPFATITVMALLIYIPECVRKVVSQYPHTGPDMLVSYLLPTNTAQFALTHPLCLHQDQR